MEPIEKIIVKEHEVACDGGPMGHPRVYLKITDEGEIDCPYCGRRYVLESEAFAAAGR